MNPFAPEPEDRQYRRRRARLVDALRQKGITDKQVLAAINGVPRHLFVDPGLRNRAYNDEALPIGLSQTISQPFTVAYQTMLLQVGHGDRVLEIGTGSGYQAAVLCRMGVEVYSVERLKPLYERTRRLLKGLGFRLTYRLGDGTLGWPAFAPFDGIIVTAGAVDLPQPLLEQLALPEKERPGGRLVIPVGDAEGQTMNLLSRLGPEDYKRNRFDGFRFVPLIGEG